jgi:lipoprotein signal peptidase
LIGAYAFLIGVVLAVIFGLFNEPLEQAGGLFYSALVVIGLIVGFMNVGDKDSHTFLMASLSLVIVGALGMEPLKYIALNNYVVDTLRNVLGSLLVLFVPATIIVALKTVFAMAKI